MCVILSPSTEFTVSPVELLSVNSGGLLCIVIPAKAGMTQGAEE